MENEREKEQRDVLLEGLQETMSKGESPSWEQITEVLEVITEDEDPGLYGLISYYAAYSLVSHGRANEAQDYLGESIRCMVGTERESRVAHCYNLLGILAHAQNNLTLAMEHYHKALDYENRYREPAVHSSVMSNIADAYFWVESYEKSCRCFEECLEELETYEDRDQTDDMNYAKTLACYGYCLAKMGRQEQALQVADKLYGQMELLGEQTPGLAVYTFLAYLTHQTGELEKSQEYLQKAMMDIEGNATTECDNLLNLIHFLIQAGRYRELQQVLDIAEPQLAMEKNEGQLVQLLFYRLKYCCDDISREEYLKYIHTFFEIKGKYEKEENAQIMRTLKLRNQLKEIEEQQEQLKKRRSRLQFQTEHDILSGLHNRRFLNRRIEECFEEAYQQKQLLAVTFVDIDYFKQMNDTHGHQEGDACIVAVASVIRRCMEGDVTVRYGGDEFVIVTVGGSREQLREKLEGLAGEIYKLQIPNEYPKPGSVVTVTMGVTQKIPQDDDRVWDYLSTADEILYRQKREQRGRIRYSYQLGYFEGSN